MLRLGKFIVRYKNIGFSTMSRKKDYGAILRSAMQLFMCFWIVNPVERLELKKKRFLPWKLTDKVSALS